VGVLEKHHEETRFIMKYKIIAGLLLSLTASSVAGTLSGKVSGASGKSVVYLDAPGKTYPTPQNKALVDQTRLQFQPHILVIQQGTTVEFLNSDSVQHNAFWPSIGGDKKAGHNLGTWPKGEKRAFKFDHPGVAPLLCNVHPEMSAYIVVSSSPYFAETDDAGNYKIDNVPDGNYTVTIWHEGGKPQSKPVTVASATKADFGIGK
jgi:plastocyanin